MPEMRALAWILAECCKHVVTNAVSDRPVHCCLCSLLRLACMRQEACLDTHVRPQGSEQGGC